MKIAFIGAGKMAEAIIGAVVRGQVVVAEDVVVSDPDSGRIAVLTERYGVVAADSNSAAAAEADVVVLAVKPQMLDSVLPELRGVLAETLVLSIAAGKQISFFEGLLPESRIVRVMPNLPCQVGEGATAYCLGAGVSDRDQGRVERLLASFGRVLELPESQFDGLTALSGSGPAFFAYVVSGLASAAEAEGLSSSDAVLLATQTMLGTAKLLIDQELAPDDLIASVSSAKGTTAEGMTVLRASALHEILGDTIAAAARRSRELSELG